jgi:muramidase (phage lysozyme)
MAEQIRGRGQCLPGTTLDKTTGFCTSGNDAFGPFTKALVARCKDMSDNDAVCETMRWAKSFVTDTRGLKPSDPWCPIGTSLDATTHMCVSADEAVGPFPEAMIDTCEKQFVPVDKCQSSRWAVGLAKTIRGKGRCPTGTKLDPQTNFCREGDNVYGPFTRELVEACRANGGGSPCEAMRWRRAFVLDDEPAPRNPNPTGLTSCDPARAQGAVSRFERALLDVISFAEGTRGASDDGYNVTFGFHTFSRCFAHPRILICSGGLCSDAAGRYQFLSTTWDETGEPTFTPDNQDRAAIKRVAFRGLSIPRDRPLSFSEFSHVMDVISFEWASLPPGRFGQPNKTLSELRTEYCRLVGC